MENLLQQIKTLEETLLQRHTRSEREMLEQLLHDDFEELAAAGRIVSKGEAIDWLLREDDTMQWSLSDFEVRRLSEEIVLATYRAYKTDPATQATSQSLRSSLWMKTGGGWVLRFHQGTPAA